MKSISKLLLLILIGLSAHLAFAEDLVYPEVGNEIVEALRFENKTEIVDGVVYESKEGQLYQVINGKKFRLRGIQAVGKSKLLPKVGALIHFDFDSSDIRQESYGLLDEFGKAFNKGLKEAVFIVAGHTDSKGSSEYNQELSTKRAKSVSDYLRVNHKIKIERLIVRGYGETKPIASNSSKIGRAKNRRVEFIRIR